MLAISYQLSALSSQHSAVSIQLHNPELSQTNLNKSKPLTIKTVETRNRTQMTLIGADLRGFFY